VPLAPSFIFIEHVNGFARRRLINNLHVCLNPNCYNYLGHITNIIHRRVGVVAPLVGRRRRKEGE
jgi:hypothetical protein